MSSNQQVAEPQKRKFGWLLLGIIVLGAFLRLGAAVWWESRIPAGERFFFGDSLSYEVLAQHLAQGEDYAYGDAYVARTPGYPLLLMPMYWFADQPPTYALRLVGIMCGTLAIWLAAWIARMLFDPLAGVLAALLVAIYPGAIAMSVFILSEAPFVPLMLLNLGWLIMALQAKDGSQRVKYAALAGLAFGLAILMRPSWLMFPLFAAPIGLLFYEHRKRQLVAYGTAALIAAIVLTPWWVRNYWVVGKFVPTTLQVGASLYDGISPMATGASDMSYVPGFKQALAESEAAMQGPLPGTFESRLDDSMKQASLGWARENPVKVIQLAGVKFWRYWTPVGNNPKVIGKLDIITALGYLPILLSGLLAVVLYARRTWVCFLLALPIFYFCCLHMVFVSSIRYRQPPMLALAILSAGLLAGWWKSYRAQPTTSTEEQN